MKKFRWNYSTFWNILAKLLKIYWNFTESEIFQLTYWQIIEIQSKFLWNFLKFLWNSCWNLSKNFAQLSLSRKWIFQLKITEILLKSVPKCDFNIFPSGRNTIFNFLYAKKTSIVCVQLLTIRIFSSRVYVLL